MNWLYWSLTIIYFISIIGIIGVVLSENRNPVKSLAWVTVLLMFPIGGIILYLFFGRSIKNTRMISRRKKRKLLRDSNSGTESLLVPDNYPPHHRQQIELGRSMLKAPFFSGNDLTIYHHATDKFQALLEDIRNAKNFIHLQYYIIENDTLGAQIAEALMERARSGVKVRIIYDHIGSLSLKKDFIERLTDAGIEIHPFFKVVFPLFATRINWRNHRKICVIDGKIGYVGGMNIADRYIDGGKKFRSWRDTHLRITGPAVSSLHYSFAVDWSFMGFPLITDKIDFQPAATNADAGMQLITSGPTSEWSNIAMLMLKAIGNARHCVYIQTPYFLPPESMLRALQAAALARVDVRIMIPRRSDSFILTYASYSYIYECLRSSIKIYLYDEGMLHSKTTIIDNDFCSIGSANIDFRSFEHNFESTMMIYSHKANAELKRQFFEDQNHSTRLYAATWRKRPMTQKAKESLVRLLSPIL